MRVASERVSATSTIWQASRTPPRRPRQCSTKRALTQVVTIVILPPIKNPRGRCMNKNMQSIYMYISAGTCSVFDS